MRNVFDEIAMCAATPMRLCGIFKRARLYTMGDIEDTIRGLERTTNQWEGTTMDR